ncbi:MAG: flavin prenyltransferase UbiX, partial [Pirellulales bacterium]
MTAESPYVIGMTGASGAVYAARLLDVLLRAGREVHLSISPSGQEVLRHELGVSVDLARFDVNEFALRLEEALGKFAAAGRVTDPVAPAAEGRLVYHSYRDFAAPIASGSFRTEAMVICPCSGGTLSAVVSGASTNLIQRAADVHLKERRTLILVPREAPLSLVHLDNMRRATEAGAVVIPASPGWYHRPQAMLDLVDFVVARICDQLGVEH